MMKLHPGLSWTRRGTLTALLAGTMIAGAGLNRASAAGNVATLSNGAAVVYSSALAHGATGNSILNAKTGKKLSFTPHAGGSLFTVDLGKSYTIAKISLNLPPHVSISVFMVPSEPAAGSSWAKMIAGEAPIAVITGHTPAVVNNLTGEYLVFDFGSYTGPFSDLVVSGSPVVIVAPAVASDVVGLHGIGGVTMTPLDEVPMTPITSP